MKITEIKNSKQLLDSYTEDKKTKAVDLMEGVGLVKRMACTKLLVLERDGKIITSNKWFVTWKENELIYDIKNNDWVNMDMFDRGESYCSKILLIEEDEK